MPWWGELNKYLRKVDYCAYKCLLDGKWEPYQCRKATGIWSNIPKWSPKRCHHKSHAGGSLIGDLATGGPDYFGKGKTQPLWYRHLVPHQLQIDILKAAMKLRPNATFVLDCFSGTQSLKTACEYLGLCYIGADIKPQVYTGKKGEQRYAKTDLCIDLKYANLASLIQRSAQLLNASPNELLMVWVSPPCTTYSQIQTINPPEKRHRDYSKLTRDAQTPEARSDDELTKHWSSQILRAIRGELELINVDLEYESTEGDSDIEVELRNDWDGYCISLREPFATCCAVEGICERFPFRNKLPASQWFAVHSTEKSAVIGFVHVFAAANGFWYVDKCEPIQPIAAKGSINMWKMKGLPQPSTKKSSS